jgi:hypothetical protein
MGYIIIVKNHQTREKWAEEGAPHVALPDEQTDQPSCFLPFERHTCCFREFKRLKLSYAKSMRVFDQRRKGK